jgi:hypothetical protein
MPGITLPHGWILHTLGPQDAGDVVYEPAAAIPASLAALLGPLHLYAVPYIGCQEGCQGSRFLAEWEPPAGEDHSSVWLELDDGIHLFLAFEGSTAHDVGFELLAAVGELAVPRLDDTHFSVYARLLTRELAEGASGEIDEDAFDAKQSAAVDYTAVSLASTIAEYVHALWHDVELRQGPEHLGPQWIRRRFELLSEWFPPNAGYRLFSDM